MMFLSIKDIETSWNLHLVRGFPSHASHVTFFEGYPLFLGNFDSSENQTATGCLRSRWRERVELLTGIQGSARRWGNPPVHTGSGWFGLDFWSYCGWKKSCTTLDGWNPINNGINHLSTGAGFLPSTVVWRCLKGIWDEQCQDRPHGEALEIVGGFGIQTLRSAATGSRFQRRWGEWRTFSCCFGGSLTV